VYSKNLSQNTVLIYAFETRNLLMIVFDREIIFLSTPKGGNLNQAFSLISRYTLKFDRNIAEVKVAPKEKAMAVSLASESDNSAEIVLYNLDTDKK